MFEQDVVKPEYIFSYTLSLLALSWAVTLLAYFGFIPLFSLAVFPFIPGLLALLFLSLEGHPVEVHARPLLRPVTGSAIIFAIVYPFLLLGLAVLVALGTGFGHLSGGTGQGILAWVLLALSAFLTAIPAALGQEYGYRGYLLPALTYWQGRVGGTIMVGIVWGLALAPASYLAFSAQDPGFAWYLAIIGFLFTIAIAFAFSYGYYLSENILPVVLMSILSFLAIPAFFSPSLHSPGAGSIPLIVVTWPSPLPLLLLVALAFVPVFIWLFSAMDGEVDGDTL